MKTKLTVIISLCFAAGFTYGQQDNKHHVDEMKSKEIRKNPDKYVNEGGVSYDDLIEQPKKLKPIVGDGFIIHPNPSDDLEIHSLNKMNDQSTEEFTELKMRMLQNMQQKFDQRVLSAPEEPYRSPDERSKNK